MFIVRLEMLFIVSAFERKEMRACAFGYDACFNIFFSSMEKDCAPLDSKEAITREYREEEK